MKGVHRCCFNCKHSIETEFDHLLCARLDELLEEEVKVSWKDYCTFYKFSQENFDKR